MSTLSSGEAGVSSAETLLGEPAPLVPGHDLLPGRLPHPHRHAAENLAVVRHFALNTEALMPPFGFTVLLLTTREAAGEAGGTMMFTRQNDGWRYLRCSTVDMLADGQIVHLGPSDHDGTVIRGGVIEHVTVRLNPAALWQVMNAREIGARVCNDAWTFSTQIMEAIRQVGRALVAPPGPPA